MFKNQNIRRRSKHSIIKTNYSKLKSKGEKNMPKKQNIWKAKLIFTLLISIIYILLLNSEIIHAQVKQEWVARYNGPGNNSDIAYSLVADDSGNVFVTGGSVGIGTSLDYATIRYRSELDTTTLQQVWASRFDFAGSIDEAYSIAIDNDRNVYVTGEIKVAANDIAIRTIKYNFLNGTIGWQATFNRPGNGEDIGRSIIVDDLGNVYVTGESKDTATGDFDYVTIKYNSSGVQKWSETYHGDFYNDFATAIAVDDTGNVYVTGRSTGNGSGGFDYATIKYDSLGVQKWVSRFDRGIPPGAGHDEAISVKLDGSGNVYVTGTSTGMLGGNFNDDYVTIKYNPNNGDSIWVRIYHNIAHDYGKALTVDVYGDVYVTGQSYAIGKAWDIATVKYNTSGVQKWVARYNGTGNGDDWGSAITVVPYTGHVYITGGSQGTGPALLDYVTMKLSASTGDTAWVQRYNGPGNNWDEAYSIDVDNSGNVYVTGESKGVGTQYDYATILYLQPPYPPLNLTAEAQLYLKIQLNWNDNSNNETAFLIERSSNDSLHYSIIGSVPKNQTGYLDSVGLKKDTIYWYRVMAINSVGSSPPSNPARDTAIGLTTGIEQTSNTPKEYKLYSNYPNPFNPTTVIKFGIPKNSSVKLIVYDILGREVAILVNEKLNAGLYECIFDGTGLTSGVYFYRIKAGEFIETKKMLMIK